MNGIKPAYYKEPIHNNKRRAPWHDYKSRCIYMITVTKAPTAQDWGYLTNINNPHIARIELSTQGKIILEEIIATPRFNPEAKILSSVIMPNHLHFLIFITRPIKKNLGDIIQAIKSSATHRIRTEFDSGNLTIFEEGFHDRILTSKGQLDTIYRYIRQNPYRLAVRRANPDFFRRVDRLRIGDKYYQAYGNTQLLDHPFKEQVIVHRADSAEQLELNRQRWLYTAANGGVLVSPFISQAEKKLRTEAESIGGKIILITAEPFSEHYKPSGHNFALCEAGRLLLISTSTTIESDGKNLSRAQCLAMNDVALSIADNQRPMPGDTAVSQV